MTGGRSCTSQCCSLVSWTNLRRLEQGSGWRGWKGRHWVLAATSVLGMGMPAEQQGRTLAGGQSSGLGQTGMRVQSLAWVARPSPCHQSLHGDVTPYQTSEQRISQGSNQHGCWACYVASRAAMTSMCMHACLWKRGVGGLIKGLEQSTQMIVLWGCRRADLWVDHYWC